MPDFFTLEMSVPVVVAVDLASETVTRVVVVDDEPGRYVYRPEPGDDLAEYRERFRRASTIADSGVAWPAWEFGF